MYALLEKPSEEKLIMNGKNRNGQLKRHSVFLDEKIFRRIEETLQKDRELANKYNNISHFIRLAIFEECKKSGILTSPLIMND